MTSRAIHDICREEPHHVKVMVRLDREFRRRGVRSYRGYLVDGQTVARLNFDHGFISVGLFGTLRWTTMPRLQQLGWEA